MIALGALRIKIDDRVVNAVQTRMPRHAWVTVRLTVLVQLTSYWVLLAAIFYSFIFFEESEHCGLYRMAFAMGTMGLLSGRTIFEVLFANASSLVFPYSLPTESFIENLRIVEK